MSNRWNPRVIEYQSTSLSFAVSLVDRFTRDRITENRLVRLRDIDVEPFRNPSGFYVFVDLPVESARLVIEGGERYFDEERQVILMDESPNTAENGTDVVTDPTQPIVIELTPTPAYRFPSTATLLRGLVRNAEGNPVSDALLTMREFGHTTQSTADGEYVLSIPARREHIHREGDRKVVKIDRNSEPNSVSDETATEPTIEVTHPDYDTVTEAVQVEVGTYTVQNITLL